LRTARLRLFGILVALPMIAGCGSAPWNQDPSSSASPTATASSSPTATASSSPSATVAELQNDLANGSTKRQLPAGGVQLSVTYFSTLSMAQWTAQGTKPLSIVVTGAFADGSKQDIFLNRVRADLDVRGVDGPIAAPAPLSDKADVTPGYLINRPASYSQVFNLPSIPAGAESVTVHLTYELLAQSAPKSKRYIKQSASDTLVIALAR
jgi:hypothetical protein